MKKDMGGAANVLALAMMIMDAGLPVDLRVLVPAVENSISAPPSAGRSPHAAAKGLKRFSIDNNDARAVVLAEHSPMPAKMPGSSC